ncbi:EthD family reductase [Zhouia sp. PK063]|uniref:EthD family reductase n=1 Tax=Zhouia sp. PK063 TaxID=3373602 RepID=UPI0037BB0166
MNNNEVVTLYVTYEKTSHYFFDKKYYVDEHIPLVLKSFKPYGLLSAQAFLPANESGNTVMICECLFESNQSIEDSFASKEGELVMDDVKNFTDVEPQRFILKKIN